jgi:hypothetical protein
MVYKLENRSIFLVLIVTIFFSCNDNKSSGSIETLEEPVENKELINGVVSATSGLNIREKPSTEAAIVGTMPHGSIFELAAIINKLEEINGIQGYWYKIKWGNIEGYSFSGHFDITDVRIKLITEIPKIKNTIYNEGLDCCGITYSEYMGTLEFKEDTVLFKRIGVTSIDCELLDPDSHSSYQAVYQIMKNGTYEIMDDHIQITMKEKYEIWEPFEDVCKNTEKIENKESIDEVYKCYPVLCDDSKKEVKGLIVPGLGHIASLIWVKEKCEE